MVSQKENKKEKFHRRLSPEEGLKEVLKYVPKGKALDIGAGEGRNSIFLAKNGFEVEAIDIVAEGLKKCKNIARENNLSIKTKVIDIRKFNFKKQNYSLIISINAIDFLKSKEIKKIITKIKYSLLPKGVFYFVGFSTRDPLARRCREKKLKEIERNTFYLPKFKTLRHFFRKREILNLFKDFKILKIEEGKVIHIHNNRTHSHWIIRAIIKKEE
jgi:2-polyprenyl-3-methyl-5-hydroxy-6-metoxy-1,4-benzoquinol methylase